MMKLKFAPGLPHQTRAVETITDLFEGQPLGQTSFEVSAVIPGGIALTPYGIGNSITLTDAQLLANVRAIQERNRIDKVDSLRGRDFAVDMETGTGKTYVYLRAICELNMRYGFKKFVVVVPSVAVREGVLKSIEVMTDHLKALYDNVTFDYFVYSSKRLGVVRQFAVSNHVQIMVINIQAFQRDVPDQDVEAIDDDALQASNVIYRDSDRMGGRPIEFVQSTNPIVIIDEPQSVDTTPRSKRALGQLKAAATLRFSATHRNPYNLLYRLGPIESYDLGLVKRIEVASIRSDDDFGDAYVKLLKTDNTRGIRAQLAIYRRGRSGPKVRRLWVRQGDDLYELSGKHFVYRQGFVVQNIDTTPGYEMVEFNQGRLLELGEELGGSKREVMRAMVRETVKQHLRKERVLRRHGVKVLSLFFVDKVADYRKYNSDGTSSVGRIGIWFEEAYRELASGEQKGGASFDVKEVHNGYFSRDGKGRARDTRGNTRADEDTYALIMRDKERLLDPNEPLRFIFSHTALREGWDSPNVFQICTLREVGSELERRQQIGRGLRLPVNAEGERVHDERLNRLTVIASEDYETFAGALQTEYEEELGVKFGLVERHAFSEVARRGDDGVENAIGPEGSERVWMGLVARGYLDSNGNVQEKFEPERSGFRLEMDGEFEDLRSQIVDEVRKYLFRNRIANAHKRREICFNKEVHLGEDFQELWCGIRQKTRYRVHFRTSELVDNAVSGLRAMRAVKRLEVSATRVEVELTRAGVRADRKLEEETHRVLAPRTLPDIVGFVQRETELTRHTIVRILKECGRLGEFLRNPQEFMSRVTQEIRRAMHGVMLRGLQYEKMADEFWEMQRIAEDAEKGISRYLKDLYEVRNREKSLFDAIEYESDVEREFAADLDNNVHVKLFVKLPGWFKIDTPVGPYNPDWAFITEREERLYFVRETKSTHESEERRVRENQKIECGRRHFEAIGTDFDVVRTLGEVEF